MKIYWDFIFKTVLPHKWYVFLECVKAGIPLRGLVHDMSKFFPSEFFAYAREFRGDRKNKPEYYDPTATGNLEFDYAWLHHQKSKHHWQSWVLLLDEGGLRALPMDHKSRLEMLCDWRGASRYYGGKPVREWYLDNGMKFELHPDTRTWIEEQLSVDESDKKHWGPGTWYKCPGCGRWDDYDNPMFDDMFFPDDISGPVHHKCYG